MCWCNGFIKLITDFKINIYMNDYTGVLGVAGIVLILVLIGYLGRKNNN
jgi:hypothetical protein